MSSQIDAMARPPGLALANRWRSSLLGRNRPLSRMLLAGLISRSGDRLHQVALAALVLGLTNSMVSAGLVFVVSMLPYALFGLLVGALVDRWDRRPDDGRGRHHSRRRGGADPIRRQHQPAARLPNAVRAGVRDDHLQSSSPVDDPGSRAAEKLGSANSLFQATNYLVDLIAFQVAGFVVAILIERMGTFRGTQAAFSFDALSYICSAALLLRLPRNRRMTASAGEPLSRLPRLAEGLRFLRSNVTVRTNTILMMVGPLVRGSLHTLWIGFAWRVSNTGTLATASSRPRTPSARCSGWSCCSVR
jgi:MFS family permease